MCVRQQREGPGWKDNHSLEKHGDSELLQDFMTPGEACVTTISNPHPEERPQVSTKLLGSLYV